jgi:hypothetical protein
MLHYFPAPLPDGHQGKAIDDQAKLAEPMRLALDYKSNSSFGSESE